MYFNARSLCNKTALLQNYLADKKPRVVAITETWATPDTPDGIYAVSGYKLSRADRIDKRGGGVMIYVHDDVCSSEVLFNSYVEFEYLCCKFLAADGHQVGFLCIYRPPNITSTGDMNLIKLIETFLNQNFRYHIITGDFNMPSVDWKSFSSPSKFSPFIDCCHI